jgi:hypothetical protein
MRNQKSSYRFVFMLVFVFALTVFPVSVSANHSLGYHWARTKNPFTLKLGDNVTQAWDSYLATASTDWTKSTVLNTTIVAGSTTRSNCRPKSGRIEVCNYRYGSNGWLGAAQIWEISNHITQAIVMMNDTYLIQGQYNTPAWRRLVMCQEIGHTFGLDHQDVEFYNPNLGTCMDYTTDPVEPPNNQHPNAHDYEELRLIYAHLDSSTTIGGAASMPAAMADGDFSSASEWGNLVRQSKDGRAVTYERDFGQGYKVVTFVIWAEAQ